MVQQQCSVSCIHLLSGCIDQNNFHFGLGECGLGRQPLLMAVLGHVEGS